MPTTNVDLDPFLEALPTPSSKRLAVRVSVSAERAVKNNHPWVFDNAITSLSHTGKSGDLAIIFDRKRRLAAIGLYDPDSPIRIKVIHSGSPQQIDTAWWQGQLAKANARRHTIPSGTNGYRLINGENDGFPGLIVDRYADTLVLKLYSTAWYAHLATLIPLIQELHQPSSIVLRLSRRLQNMPAPANWVDGATLFGHEPQAPILFQENGLTFEADVTLGQKTGFFLDQRDNRAKVRQLAAEKSVLDVFSSSGGFSVYAAAGGAKTVTAIDLSTGAIEAAKRNMLLNEHLLAVSNCPFRTIKGDAFEQLEKLAAKKLTFDMVIVDPPAFAQKQADVEHALRAYVKLTRLALAVLEPNGILVSASCSSRVSAEQFMSAIHHAAASVKRPLSPIAQTSHAIDHPIGFPEGAYLKCLFANA